ncbi:MAG: pilus assembly PilX N-terminal domain-containing protein [Firmicutes bacterium]|nr:pilus assembly PilX N-terminal domain-containing protein [Bacillota bacterium]
MVKNRHGSALVMVMVYALVLIILGIAILGVAVNEYRMEAAHRNVVKAYYLAEAGMEKAIFEITEMETILPSFIGDKEWEMGPEDSGLVESGVYGDFKVTVGYVEIYDEIFVGEGEDIVLYKTIYEIKLKSMAVCSGAPAGLEAIILVENYENSVEDNKVEVWNWRQIRGVEDED